MEAIQIVILIAGALLFTISFFIPEKQTPSVKSKDLEEKLAKEAVAGEVAQAKSRIEETADDVVEHTKETTQRSLDRLTNEKMNAISEYSDTVMEQIHKNHEEAVFLYDMLNNKHAQLKNTAVEVDHMIKSSRQAGAAAATAAKNETAKNDAAKNETKYVDKTSYTNKSDSDKAYADKAYTDKAYTDKRNIDEAFINGKNTGSEPVPAKQDYATAPNFEPIHPQRVITKENLSARHADAVKERTMKSKENQPATGKTSSGKEQADLVQTQIAAKQVPLKINKRKNGAVEITFDTDQSKSGNSNEKILNLHKAGKSNMAIAKELGLGIGEVKLVIDLFEGI